MSRIAIARLTLRARLTLVYAGLFLLAGMALLGVTYGLVSSQQQPDGQRIISGGLPEPRPSASQHPTPASSAQVTGEVGGLSGDHVTETQIAGDARRRTLNALLTQGGIALGLVGVAATAFGWLIAGRMLRPLHRVTETARRIADAPAADRGLHERIALNGPPDELKRLADTFDLMLERLDHSFDGQRRFIANASHELRTPLTLNRTLLEVALDPRTASPEVRQLGATLLAINDRHERLIDGLLLLARSEREVTEQSLVDLADVVEHVAAQFPAGTVRVLTQAGEAETTGSPVLLERLVQNLVENGVRYNVPEGGWVRVATGTRSDGRVELTVSNTGAVVPRYEIPGIFEPFHRLTTDRLAADRATGDRAADDRAANRAGAGLGLSIVRAIARAHGGEAHAEPREGGGLVVTVTLPGAPPPAGSPGNA